MIPAVVAAAPAILAVLQELLKLEPEVQAFVVQALQGGTTEEQFVMLERAAGEAAVDAYQKLRAALVK